MALKLVIVGGVAGGATAAARARRLDEQAEIVVFERGEHISFANCGLPYYIGQIIKKRDRLLVTTAAALRSRYNIDVRNFSEVTAIDRMGKQLSTQLENVGEILNTGIEARLSFDILRRCYAKAGVADHCRALTFDSPHQFIVLTLSASMMLRMSRPKRSKL